MPLPVRGYPTESEPVAVKPAGLEDQHTFRLVRTRSRSVTIVSFRTPEQRTALFSRVLPFAEVVEL